MGNSKFFFNNNNNNNNNNNKEIMSFLDNLKVSDIPAPKEIITVKSDETFVDAFNKLIGNSILSAPVRDVKTNKYVGFLEMRDLLSILLLVEEDDRSKVTDIDALLKHVHDHLKVNDGVTLTYIARRHQFKSVKSDASLLGVAELLSSHGASRTRRVAVVDDNDEIINIVTQSGLVHYISKHIDDLGDAGNKTIKALKLGTSPVKTVSFGESAHTTLQLLDKSQISGLAITNEENRLFGHISGRDLKNFVTKPDLTKLRQPIKQFLAELRNEKVDIGVPTILCFEHSTLAEVIAKLSATKVHRLYVVDGEENLKPIRVVSVSDVVSEIVKHCKA